MYSCRQILLQEYWICLFGQTARLFGARVSRPTRINGGLHTKLNILTSYMAPGCEEVRGSTGRSLAGTQEPAVKSPAAIEPLGVSMRRWLSHAGGPFLRDTDL